MVLWPWRRSQGRAFLAGVAFIAVAIVTGIEAYIVIGPLVIPTTDLEARPLLMAISAGSLYAGLAFLLNRSEVLVRRSLLRIRHGPLPFLWSRRLTRDVIDQLYCKESRREWKDEEDHEHLTVSFSLVAALRSGRRVTLLSGLESADQALWLERAFEQMLAIEDQPVAGESFLSMAKPGRR